MHKDEVHTDSDLVAALLDSQFPQWAGLPIRRVSSAGTDNALYRVGVELLVRLPRIEWAVGELAIRERWLPRLAPSLSHPVAAPIASGEPEHGFPWRWSVYTWLSGRNPVVGAIARPDELAMDLARFISSLRSVEPTGGPSAGYRGGHLFERDRATRAAIANLDGLIDTVAVTAAWQAALALPASEASDAWLHADLSPGNLLVVDERLSAVIDFTPGIGLPDCELIVAWNLLPVSGRRVLREALQADDEAWGRGRGWALSIALLQLDYYRLTNPLLAANARHVINEVLASV